MSLKTLLACLKKPEATRLGTDGPWNPTNGHSFLCNDIECRAFWDSALGAQCFEEWRRVNKFPFLHGRSKVVAG